MRSFSPQATCLTLRLEKSEDISLTHGALHVPDDGAAALVLEELDANLRHATTGASASEHLDHPSLLSLDLLGAASVRLLQTRYGT